MKAPFTIFNIAPGLTEIKFKSYSSSYFMRNEVYPVREIYDNKVLTTDEHGKPHTLSLDFMNKNCELVNPVDAIVNLQEILQGKVAEKDLKGMDEVYNALKEAVDKTIVKILPEQIYDGALFESDEFFILVVELPQQGFKYMRTKKDERNWHLCNISYDRETLAALHEGFKYKPLSNLPYL